MLTWEDDVDVHALHRPPARGGNPLDWLDLPDPPSGWGWGWGWGKTAHLLVGSLAHSGRWRAVLAPSMDQPHLVDGLDRVSRAVGGVTRRAHKVRVI